MSGGHFDYFYIKLEDMFGVMQDPELNDLVEDIAIVFHDLEWWQSGDYSEEDYRETVNTFKKKWLRGQPTKRLKKIIDQELEAKKLELYQMIGVPEAKS